MRDRDRDRYQPRREPSEWVEAKWFERAVLVAVVLAVAVVLSPRVPNAELSWHIQQGREIVLGRPSGEEAVAEGLGYQPATREVLGQVLLALTAHTVGAAGVAAGKCLLGVLIVWLVMRHAYSLRVGFVALGTIALLVAVNLAAHWTARPELLAYLCYSLLLVLLSYCFTGWEGSWHLPWLSDPHAKDGEWRYSSPRMRHLWLAVVLFLAWANTHPSFLAGYAMFVAYLGLRSVEAVFGAGRSGAGILKRFAMMAVASGLATFVNPAGPLLHIEVLSGVDYKTWATISWADWSATSPTAVPMYLLLGTSVFCLLFTSQSRDFTHLAMLVFTFRQTLCQPSLTPLLAISVGFWVSPHLDAVLQRLGVFRPQYSLGLELPRVFRWALVAAIVGTYAFLGWHLVSRLGPDLVRWRTPDAAPATVARQSPFNGVSRMEFDRAGQLAGGSPAL